MTIKNLYASITGTTKPESVSVNHSHSNAVAIAIIRAENTSLSVGDSISVDMGYTTNHKGLFTGYVKRIEREVPEDIYTITAHDTLVRAVDFFIASTNPDAPFSRYRINAEDLIGDLLALAGITNYVGDTTNFIYAWTIQAEINLVGCFEFCKQLADMLAWHIYAKTNGQIRFLDRKPYVMVGDTPLKTLTDVDFTTAQYGEFDDDLRNRVVVYGANGIYAEAKAASPYLPAGYYKTSVLSSFIVDRQDMADDAASYNLAKWNRLGKSFNISAIGDPDLVARNVVTINSIKHGINSDWYIHGSEQKLDKTGYYSNLELRQ